MTCLWCGAPLETTNRRARYCSASCRSQAHRTGAQAVPITDRQSKGGELVAITRRQLEELGLDEEDVLARAALALARAFDDPRTPPSALVSLSKGIQVHMAYLRERAAEDEARSRKFDYLGATDDD